MATRRLLSLVSAPARAARPRSTRPISAIVKHHDANQLQPRPGKRAPIRNDFKGRYIVEPCDASPVDLHSLLSMSQTLTPVRTSCVAWSERSEDYRKTLFDWAKKFGLGDIRIESLANVMYHSPVSMSRQVAPADVDGLQTSKVQFGMLQDESLDHRDDKIHVRSLAVIGDAVLDLMVVSYLFQRYPTLKPKQAHRRRMNMVSDESISFVGQDYFELDSVIVYQDKENLDLRQKFGTRVYSDVLEALMGIVYVDLGIARAALFAQHHIIPSLAQFDQVKVVDR
eukprot:TRINITY_DN2109_c0_g1_i1.p1 TRINITY_DN2109_c0_g1~~TRINITY_DN2109_c0_g1_i1.p1  ORF type:complete len:292 (+),score=42.00 TRINITY_DN2109_c0_g1_i1:30-878(+)